MINRHVFSAGQPADVSAVLPSTSTSWTIAQGGTVASYYNAADFQQRQYLQNTTGIHSGWLRQFLNLNGTGNYLPGTVSQINCDKPWKVSFLAYPQVGSANYKWTLFIGGVNSAGAGTAGTLTLKGWGICITGTGANAANIQAVVHDGTSQTVGTGVAIPNCDGRAQIITATWRPGVGLFIAVNGVLIASVTTGLPSGSTSAGYTGWVSLLEHTAGVVGDEYMTIGPINVTHLQP